MLRININTTHFDKTLGGIINRLDNTKPLMAGISEELVGESEQQFRDEASSDGKWQDLAKSTKKQRAKVNKWPGKKLQVSGALARSVQGYHGDTVAGVIAGSGQSAAYAAIHLFGGKAGKGRKTTIPARRYLPIVGTANNAELSKDVTKRILLLARNHILRTKNTE